MSLRNKIKSLLVAVVGIDVCDECGKHVKHTYQYTNGDGDTECCLRCDCGNCWHSVQHTGQ